MRGARVGLMPHRRPGAPLPANLDPTEVLGFRRDRSVVEPVRCLQKRLGPRGWFLRSSAHGDAGEPPRRPWSDLVGAFAGE